MPEIICPACGQQVIVLVKHHWYELPNLALHTKDICDSCNEYLTTSHFYPKYYREHREILHHVLPNWDTQLTFIQSKTRKTKTINRTTTVFTIRIKKGLLAELDTQAIKQNTSRNAWIVRAIKQGLRKR